MENVTRLDRTTLEIDLHLVDLWREIGEMDFPLDTEEVATLLHAAYAFGYLDCLREPVPGELCRAFGWKMPKKTAPDSGAWPVEEDSGSSAPWTAPL